jgi:hypothetical protein
MPTICAERPLQEGCGNMQHCALFILETAEWGPMVDRSEFKLVDSQEPIEEAGISGRRQTGSGS